MGRLLTVVSFAIVLSFLPSSCHAKDLVIRERSSGDQEVLAFLIGFILFLSILVIASLVSRCVWRDHRISSRRHLNPHPDSLGQDSSFGNQNSDSLYPRSRSFLASLIHDDPDSDDDDYDDEEEEEALRQMSDAARDTSHKKEMIAGSMNPHSTACPSSSSCDRRCTHEIRRNGKDVAPPAPASSSFSSSLSSAAIHLFTSSSSSSSSSGPSGCTSSSLPLSCTLSSSSAKGCRTGRLVRTQEGSYQESSMCEGSPVGERTHLIQYKRLCVRIKNPDTSCGSRYDGAAGSHSSNSISYL